MEASLTCRHTLNFLVRWASKTANTTQLPGSIHVDVTMSELERDLRLEVLGFNYPCVHQTNMFIILQNIVYNSKLRENDMVVVDYIISLHMGEEYTMSKTRSSYTSGTNGSRSKICSSPYSGERRNTDRKKQ